MDTINANGGKAGFHPAVYGRHLTTAAVREGMTTESLAAMTTELQRNEIKARVDAAAKESACGEYLACLFLLLSNNNRFAAQENHQALTHQEIQSVSYNLLTLLCGTTNG